MPTSTLHTIYLVSIPIVYLPSKYHGTYNCENKLIQFIYFIYVVLSINV